MNVQKLRLIRHISDYVESFPRVATCVVCGHASAAFSAFSDKDHNVPRAKVSFLTPAVHALITL